MKASALRGGRLKARVAPRSLEFLRRDIENADPLSTAATVVYDNLRQLLYFGAHKVSSDDMRKHYLLRLTDSFDLPRTHNTKKNIRRPATLAYYGMAKALHDELQITDSMQVDVGDARYFIHRPRFGKLSLLMADASGNMADGFELYRTGPSLPFEPATMDHLKILREKVPDGIGEEGIPEDLSLDLEAFGARLHRFGGHMLQLADQRPVAAN